MDLLHREELDLPMLHDSPSSRIRSYKLKLDEWEIRKNKTRATSRSQRLGVGEQRWTPPRSDMDFGSPLSSDVSVSPTWHSLPSRPKDDLAQQTIIMPLTKLDLPLASITDHNHRSTLDVNVDPLINSSLMFFSTQTDSENLQHLSQCPGIEPRAIEIVLRNWKTGSLYLAYLTTFLQGRRYCESLLGINWTRWTDTDETLFDLVNENVSPEEQGHVYKLLLEADLTFRHPLSSRNVSWAVVWRKAIQESEWPAAKGHLSKMDAASPLLVKVALSVAAEYLSDRVGTGTGRAVGW